VELLNSEPTPAVTDVAPTEADLARQRKEESLSPGQAAIRRFLRDKRAVVSLVIIFIVCVGSFVFPYFYQHLGPKVLGGPGGATLEGPELYHLPYWNELTRSDGPPTLFPLGPNSWVNPLGADTLGRDTLAELMTGVQTSITIALAVEVFDVGLGLLFGLLAGYFGGWLDTILARFTDIVFAFPGLLLIVLAGASLGPVFDNFIPGSNARVILIILIIGLLVWPLMMRFVRGQALTIKEQQYVEAARTVGTSPYRIITRHIVPNLLNIVVVASTLNVLGTIVTEAGISLLGVGIRPPKTSLGLMLSQAVNQIFVHPLELVWPVLTLVILIVCIAFIGDGVRDAFDPRTKD
jgi:ABC-type dipeptide/oligopeptide/nickel transport system permease subunit